MRCGGQVLLAAALAAAPVAYGLDFSKVTCRQFLASGQANMAPIMMWLRGYHAGKVGAIPYDSADRWRAQLGFYCRSHPDDNLIEMSGRLLAEQNRGL